MSYWRTSDTDLGLTTETTLLVAVLLGGLAQRQVATAAGLAVVVTILIAVRAPIHLSVQSVLSEDELRDAIIFPAAVLIILPLTPNRYVGPYAVINGGIIWKLAILIMSISAVGHVAVRVAGFRFGSPIAGLTSGFVSSTATIVAMDQPAAQNANVLRAAAVGAVLSTSATTVQLVAVPAPTSELVLYQLRVPLLAAGTMALVYGGVLTFFSIRQPLPQLSPGGRAFNLRASLLLAGMIAAVLCVSGVLNAWFGEKGVVAAAAIAGFADTHSPAVSVASLVAGGKLAATESAVPILTGLTTNTVSKIVIAGWSGGWPFAVRVVPGLFLVIMAAWTGFALAPAR